MKKVSMFLLCLCAGLVFASFTHKASASKIGVSIPGNYLGLVGYWTFDGKDVPNGRANDLSGNGNHGNLVNIATSTFYAPGKIGQAFRFDGTNDYAVIPQTSPLQLSNADFTISLWVNDSRPGSQWVSGAAYDRLISWYDGSKNIQVGIGNGPNTNDTNSIAYLTVNSSTAPAQAIATVNIYNAWHFITVTMNSGSAKIYIDGIDRSGGSTGGNPGVQTSNSTQLFIGQRGDNAAYANSLIDDVRIYNRALSSTEIQQLYNMAR